MNHSLKHGPSEQQLKSLGARKYAALTNLIGQFDRESHRCAKAGAYYAACVLQVATLEGLLLAMCDAFLDEVSKFIAELPSEQRPKGPIQKWTLAQLIKVARGLEWLPSRTHIRGRREIGDWVDVLKEMRNIVHPGKHIRDYASVRLRRGNYSDAYGIVRLATDELWTKVSRDLSAKSPQKKGRK